MKPLRMMLTTFILIQLNSIDVEAQYVLVNQAGYLPDQVKYAYFISPDDSFYVIEKTSGIVQFAIFERSCVRPDDIQGGLFLFEPGRNISNFDDFFRYVVHFFDFQPRLRRRL